MTDYQDKLNQLKQITSQLDAIATDLFLDGAGGLNDPMHEAWMRVTEAAIKAEAAYKALKKD